MEVATPPDGFEDVYAQGVLDGETEQPVMAMREAREGTARRDPGAAFAVRGCVLTPDEVVADGWVVVSGGQISDVRTAAPEGVDVLETDGIVLPGLIDLHGHPEYNVFAAWEPPQRYVNRYAWRRSQQYAAVIKQPWALLTGTADATGTTSSLLPTLTRYAEARALIGGCTAIQGASGRYPDRHEALVRNVDLRLFGEHRARSMIDLGRADDKERKRLRQLIDDGAVTALYVHLAEGTDERSRREFTELVEASLLTPATVIIHGTALSPEQLGQVADAGAKLVWSPQSNLRLYGATTNAAAARTAGVRLGLGADWLPSGSPSLLDEAQVARRVLAEQGAPAAPADLVRMMTSDAASIAGVGERLGRLQPGRPADLCVLERLHDDPWESVLRSNRHAVELVTIGGDVAYGRTDWVEALAGPTEMEPVLAWGKAMALDLTYTVAATETVPPRLGDLRAALLGRYPQVGPIFA